MVGFYFAVMTIYFAHAFVDCVCTVLILFYPNKINAHTGLNSQPASTSTTVGIVVDGDNDNNCNKNSNANASTTATSFLSFSLPNMKIDVFLGWCSGLLELYYLLFIDSVSDIFFMRVFMYWVAAMSLSRAVALCWPCTPTLITVAVMYLLEALAVEFEGFTHKTVRPEYARKFSLFCLGMCLFSFLLTIFV
jgi:hypothetical protein